MEIIVLTYISVIISFPNNVDFFRIPNIQTMVSLDLKKKKGRHHIVLCNALLATLNRKERILEAKYKEEAQLWAM